MRHELHLTKSGLRVLALAMIPLLAGGVFVDGPDGAGAVVLAAAIMAANHVLMALSTGWARRVTPTVIGVAYGGFVFRMFGVFAAFSAATALPWVHKGVFATAFCAALAVTLGAECVSFARRSYVPRWRLTA